ncbi:MAG TPA: hypothetical protein PLT92_12385 [Ignavibacteriaceae bacterium]|nr:hypothetical protein [Ignavibacteriaceae bacterium]HPO55386.1 hypothetical protein [Ignavibacteriaceae bacterium]
MSIKCVSCDSGEGEVYDLFVFRRYGTRNDQIGVKFFFYCPECQGPVCKECLGRKGDLFAEEAEYETAMCPKCNSRLYAARGDNRSDAEMEWCILNFLKNGNWPALEEKKLRSIKGGEIEWLPFKSESVMGITEGLGFRIKVQGEEMSLVHYRYPEPFSVLYLRGESFLIERKDVFSDSLFSVTADNEGFFIVNRGSEEIEVNAEGVSRGEEGGKKKEEREKRKEKGEKKNPTQSEENEKKEMLRRKLGEINERHIWDFQFINEDKTEGKGEIHIAGSTDLIYYHIVEMFFKKVRFSNLVNYFHHPRFEVADGALEEQVRQASGVSKEDFCVFVVSTDKGGFNERRYVVVAKHLFVEWESH